MWSSILEREDTNGAQRRCERGDKNGNAKRVVSLRSGVGMGRMRAFRKRHKKMDAVGNYYFVNYEFFWLLKCKITKKNFAIL